MRASRTVGHMKVRLRVVRPNDAQIVAPGRQTDGQCRGDLLTQLIVSRGQQRVVEAHTRRSRPEAAAEDNDRVVGVVDFGAIDDGLCLGRRDGRKRERGKARQGFELQDEFHGRGGAADF